MWGNEEPMGDPAEIQRPGMRASLLADDHSRTHQRQRTWLAAAVRLGWHFIGAAGHISGHVHTRHRVHCSRSRRRHGTVSRADAHRSNNESEHGGHKQQSMDDLHEPHAITLAWSRRPWKGAHENVSSGDRCFHMGSFVLPDRSCRLSIASGNEDIARDVKAEQD